MKWDWDNDVRWNRAIENKLASSSLEASLEKTFPESFWKNQVKPALIKCGGIITGSWPFQQLTGRTFAETDIDIFVVVTPEQIEDAIKSKKPLITEIEQVFWNHERTWKYKYRPVQSVSSKLSSYCELNSDHRIRNVRDYISKSNPQLRVQIIQISVSQHLITTTEQFLLNYANEFDLDICKTIYYPKRSCTVTLPLIPLRDYMNGKSNFTVMNNVDASIKRYKKYTERGIIIDVKNGQKEYTDLVTKLQKRHLKGQPFSVFEFQKLNFTESVDRVTVEGLPLRVISNSQNIYQNRHYQGAALPTKHYEFPPFIRMLWEKADVTTSPYNEKLMFELQNNRNTRSRYVSTDAGDLVDYFTKFDNCITRCTGTNHDTCLFHLWGIQHYHAMTFPGRIIYLVEAPLKNENHGKDKRKGDSSSMEDQKDQKRQRTVETEERKSREN